MILIKEQHQQLLEEKINGKAKYLQLQLKRRSKEKSLVIEIMVQRPYLVTIK